MSTATLQNNLHNCQETLYIKPMPLFDAERFAAWLSKAFSESKYKSYAQLAEATGVTRSYISSLIRAGDQLLTRKPSRPGADLVIKLAEALDQDVNEALILAGHAPMNGPDPENIYRDMLQLTPGMRNIASRQIRAILNVLTEAEGSNLPELVDVTFKHEEVANTAPDNTPSEEPAEKKKAV